MRLDEFGYDFERDEWVAHRLLQARWIERELPAPALAPSPGIWHAKKFPLNNHYYFSHIGLCFVTLLGCLLIAYVCLNGLDRFALFGTIVVSLLLPPILSKIVRRRTLDATSMDRRLIEDPWDLDVCLVEIEIYRNGPLIGVDRGVAWFESGRLLFNGMRTSFAIGGEDVQPRRLWTEVARTTRIPVVPLRVEGDARIEFRPLQATKLPIDHEERFVERLAAFRARPPQSRGPRQWPPLES